MNLHDDGDEKNLEPRQIAKIHKKCAVHNFQMHGGELSPAAAAAATRDVDEARNSECDDDDDELERLNINAQLTSIRSS
jgi:hypothetical protein